MNEFRKRMTVAVAASAGFHAVVFGAIVLFPFQTRHEAYALAKPASLDLVVVGTEPAPDAEVEAAASGASDRPEATAEPPELAAEPNAPEAVQTPAPAPPSPSADPDPPEPVMNLARSPDLSAIEIPRPYTAEASSIQPATPVSLPANGVTAAAAQGGAPGRFAPAPSSLGASAVSSTPATARYLRNPKPAYPPSARKLRQEGLVVLRVQVNASGRATSVEVQTSSGFDLLDDAARRAVRRWEFVPARVGNSAVLSEVEVPVRFQLGD